jgi:hypothetical protein
MNILQTIEKVRNNRANLESERKRCGMYPTDQAHDDCLELLKVVDELLNGKALNSLHNQIVKLEVENSNLKKRLNPEPKNFHNDIMQDIDPLGQEFG